MAERIENFVPSKGGRPAIYPWSEWMDGRAWRIRRGEDFDAEPDSMAQTIRVHGRRNGMPASATVDGDCVEFQFTPSQEQAA